LIGGRACVYLLIVWGINFIILGYNILRYLKEMGTDPQCLLGWENIVKWHLFIPIFCSTGVSLLLILIVMCNINYTLLRRSSMVKELTSTTYGLLMVIVLFCGTWITGSLAFIRSKEIDLPDFQPLFQVLNSWSGVTTFMFLGLCSSRYRSVIQESVKERKME